MAIVKIHFLAVDTPDNARSARQQNLNRAEALSHAATVSHLRAGRGLHPIDDDDEKRGAGGTGCLGSRPARKGQRSSYRSKDLRRQQRPGPAAVVELKAGVLDPFIQLPINLGTKDRQLLHVYLTLTPRRNYGLQEKRAFCPVRDYGIPQFNNNATFLHLYLLQAEIATQAPASDVYARRAIIYAGMKKRIEQPQASIEDSTLVLLGGWGTTESRFGFPGLAQQHFRAVLRLCKLRGGLQVLHKMAPAVGMGLMLCLLHPQMPYFDSRLSLIEALEHFTLPKGRMIDKQLWRYFTPDSQQRGHLWNLYMMNQVMSQDPPPEFQTELLNLVLSSGPNMLATAMQFIIPTVVARLGRWQHNEPLVRAWEVVEFVCLMQYSTPDGIQAVQSAMSAWLTGVPEAVVDMESVKKGILTNWDRAHMAFPI